MKLLSEFVLFILFNIIRAEIHFKCPDNDDLGDCECDQLDHSLICEDINLPTFSDLKQDVHFKSITIKRSLATDIPFKHITTEKLILEENEKLLLTSNEIQLLKVEYLKITNNNKIQSKLLLEKGLNNIKSLEISGEELGELNKIGNFDILEDLYLKNNKITKLGDNIFTGMSNIKYVHVQNNKINELGYRSLTFNSDVTFDLSNNQINLEMLTKVSPSLTRSNYKLDLDLTSNQIDHLTLDPFSNIVESKININLDNNPIQCSYRENSWVFYKLISKDYLHNVKCNNYNDADLFEMSVNDFVDGPLTTLITHQTYTTILLTDMPPTIKPNDQTTSKYDSPPTIQPDDHTKSKHDIPPTISPDDHTKYKNDISPTISPDDHTKSKNDIPPTILPKTI